MSQKLEDELIAQSFACRALLIQVLVEIGSNKEDPERWAKDFITDCYSRIDTNDAATNSPYPWHELARISVDHIARDLQKIMKLHAQK